MSLLNAQCLQQDLRLSHVVVFHQQFRCISWKSKPMCDAKDGVPTWLGPIFILIFDMSMTHCTTMSNFSGQRSWNSWEFPLFSAFLNDISRHARFCKMSWDLRVPTSSTIMVWKADIPESFHTMSHLVWFHGLYNSLGRMNSFRGHIDCKSNNFICLKFFCMTRNYNCPCQS